MDNAEIAGALRVLNESGLPMQDVLAAAIRRGPREIIVEIAKHFPEAVSLNLSWAGYTSEITYSCVDLVCDSNNPSLYWDIINNAPKIPSGFEGACRDIDDDEIVYNGNAAVIAMRVGIQVNTALAIKDSAASAKIRESAIRYLSGQCDDISSYAVDVLNTIDSDAEECCDVYDTTELGWFFLDAIEVLIGHSIECAWTIAHPKAKEDTI